MKTLIIVESGAKAKKIQKYLGSDYIVRESQGHIYDLAISGTNKLGIDLENEFKPKYVLNPDKKDKVRTILDAAEQADLIYLASDPDREGEAIAFHLALALKTKKPIKRVLFHEITPAGIKKGLANPLELNQALYDAQQARRVIDRLVGFLVSPWLINHQGPNLSAGRVQSVAVRLIVDREREIENFKPEEYWSITANLAKKTKLEEGFIAKYLNKVTNKKDADKIKADLDKDSYIVTDVVAEEKEKKPGPPLITSTLQQVAARRFGLSSARIMKAAQALYEAGHVSYIRTDSVRCSPESIEAVRDWLKENKYDIPNKPNIYATKSSAQDAHEAIRPTNVSKKPGDIFLSSEEEKQVYQVVWERFVASQMKPAIYDTVVASIKSSSDHLLKAYGRVLKYKGWLAITNSDLKEDDEENKLPILKVKDELALIPPGVKAEKKATQPPPRYKEYSLVAELEKKEIGRPSTYAPIMQKLTDRGYVEKLKDTFHPTELGKKVVDNLIKYFKFMEYKYTADMETQLDKIEEGKLKYLELMNIFFPELKEQVRGAYAGEEKDYGINCDKCGKSMRLKHGRFGYYLACQDYPICKSSKSCELVDNKPVIVKNNMVVVENQFCPKCNSGMHIKDGKFGKFYSCTKYPKCNGSAKLPFGKKCIKCGNELYLTIFNGEPKLACMGYPACRNIEAVPEGAKTNWVNPKLLTKPKPKKVEKILYKTTSNKRK